MNDEIKIVPLLPTKHRCPVCGYTKDIKELYIERCPQCYEDWVAKNVPLMKRV